MVLPRTEGNQVSWTHLSDKDVKTRKPHQCFLCEEDIPKGTICRRRTGTQEGDIFTFYMHEECRQVTLEWDDEHWEYHDAGEFRRELEEHRKQVEKT